MNPLKSLFLDELANRYDAEKRLLRTLPRMAKHATCEDLQQLIQSHLRATASHVKQLEGVFKSFDATVRAKKCEATIGLLKDGAALATDYESTAAINAALISVAQKIEHHEIASYGCLHEWSALLGNKPASGILKEILDEKKAASQALRHQARSHGNREALAQGQTADSCSNGNRRKTLNGRRGFRPLNLRRLRSVLM